MLTPPDTQLLALYQQLYAATDPEEFAQLQEEAHARYLELFAATTPTGLPYPSPTDPISQGADAIRALAQAIDTQIPVRQVGYNYAAISGFQTLTTSLANISGSQFTIQAVAGQRLIIKAIVNLLNANSGSSRSANLAILEGGVSIQNRPYAVPLIAGVTMTTAIIMVDRTPAASGPLTYVLQGQGSAAASVQVYDTETVITRAPVSQ